MTITITLPDNSTRNFDAPITGMQLAEDIGPGLAKAVVAMKVDGAQRDIYLPIERDAKVELLTTKQPEGLDVMRHTLTAQVLARALKEMYPGTKLAIGPTIEHGFYYDVESPKPIVEADLERIEARMREIMTEDNTVTREMWERDAAIKLFEGRGEPYKAEIIENAPVDDTTEAGKISLYRQGEGDDANNETDFIDLCRGPHVPHFKYLSKAFKLTGVSGAYWRGDSKGTQLTRIYGIMFADEKKLKQHLTMLEEANKRDHRKLGKELDLFHIEEHSPGMIFWHDKGWAIYLLIQQFIRQKLRKENYIEVKTPILVDRSLWEASGHWDKFHENMFTSEVDDGEKTLAVKPMNCPCHVQIFNQGIKSYRDLPLRMAEFGTCHRNESSGSMHGIMRVREFIQDDAHIFCTEEQITSETISFCELLLDVYKAFGFEEVKVKFSDRPETRAGSDAVWDKAEGALIEAVKATGLEYTLNPGEGAFYGPKLEFVLTDAIGRDWQCGTLQVDFVLPERLDANYVGEDGEKHRPVMLHRAILGSMERFFGILVEEYAGRFPVWLAPTQVAVTTITDGSIDYAKQVKAKLEEAGVRAVLDSRNEKINYKVREHSNAKVPYILAVGDREVEAGTVAVRTLGEQGQKVIPFDEFMEKLKGEASA